MPAGWASLALLAGLILLAAWQASTNFRLNRMVRHYRALSAGVEGQPLDAILQRVLDRADIGQQSVRELEQRIVVLNQAVQGHIQKLGIVRYNAFEDTGGDQSFAIAMLDANGNGAIFNGLYHRTVCRVFAKPVIDWRSTYALSDEEEEAIRKARAA
ncbi:MAG: DUF4446 family protein [Candidatus Dormibacteria bacterium]